MLKAIDSNKFWRKALSANPVEIPKELDIIFDNVAEYITNWQYEGNIVDIDCIENNSKHFLTRSIESLDLLINILTRENKSIINSKSYYDSINILKKISISTMI